MEMPRGNNYLRSVRASIFENDSMLNSGTASYVVPQHLKFSRGFFETQLKLQFRDESRHINRDLYCVNSRRSSNRLKDESDRRGIQLQSTSTSSRK